MAEKLEIQQLKNSIVDMEKAKAELRKLIKKEVKKTIKEHGFKAAELFPK